MYTCVCVCVCTEVKCLPVFFTQLSEGSTGGSLCKQVFCFGAYVHAYVCAYVLCMYAQLHTNKCACTPAIVCVCI